MGAITPEFDCLTAEKSEGFRRNMFKIFIKAKFLKPLLHKNEEGTQWTVWEILRKEKNKCIN